MFAWIPPRGDDFFFDDFDDDFDDFFDDFFECECSAMVPNDDASSSSSSRRGGRRRGWLDVSDVSSTSRRVWMPLRRGEDDVEKPPP